MERGKRGVETQPPSFFASMSGYLTRRFLHSIIIIIGISMAVFVISRFTGDPVSVMVGPDTSQADRAAIRKELGLDRPIPIQYLFFMKGALQGNFGKSIRYILLAILIIVGSSINVLILVIGLTEWIADARVVRGETLAGERIFIIFACAIGARDLRIIVDDIFPNMLSSLMVLITLNIATVIVLEAGLSFLGLGIEPPDLFLLGTHASESKDYLNRAWWLNTLPGSTIMMIILAINLFGDGLGDVLYHVLRKLLVEPFQCIGLVLK